LLWRRFINYSRLNQLELKWLIKAYQTNDKSKFFNPFLPNLQEPKLQQQIEAGISESNQRKLEERIRSV
jgi:hypothetical protein